MSTIVPVDHDIPQQQLRPFHIPPLTMHLVRFLVLVMMVGLGIHLLLPQIAGLERSWAVVQTMPVTLVVLAAAAQLGNYGGTGLMMNSLTNLVGEKLSIRRGTIIAIAGPSIGMVAGGYVGNSAITYRWVRGSGIERLGAALCATLPLALIHFMLLLVSLVGMVTLFTLDQLTALEVISFAMLLVVLAALAFIALWGMTHPNELTERATPLVARYRAWRHQPFDPAEVVDHVDALVNCGVVLRTGWHGPAVGAVLNIGFDMFTLYVLFLAAGYQLPISMLLAGYGVPLLVGRLPITPGGAGLVEATMTAVFIGLGAPSGSAVVAVLGYRLLSFWIPTFLGFPLAAYLRHVTRPAEIEGAGGEAQTISPDNGIRDGEPAAAEEPHAWAQGKEG